jgi:hypothetical protein
VQRIFTIVTWVTRLCLRSLHHCFVAWTKPDTTSLMLGTLTDLVRSKSELVAENARYASAIDHPAAPGEAACLYQDGSDAPGPAVKNGTNLETSPRHCPARDATAVAPPGLQALLEMPVEGSFSQAKTIPGDYLLDSGDGKGQSASSEQNGFVVNALSLGRHVCLPHHSEVHESRAYHQAARTDLGHLRGRTMPKTSGLATFSQSLIFSSVRFSPSSLSNSTLGE